MPGFGSSTLIINAGSSSVKFRLYQNNAIVIDGVVDAIGKQPRLSFVEKEKYRETRGIRVVAKNYAEAGMVVLRIVERYISLTLISKVVHRVVHGRDYNRPMRITSAVLKDIERLSPLAPLHQPQSLQLIQFFMKYLGAQHIACFDTMFHVTMPAVAETYAIPQTLAHKYRIKRYGLSHAALFYAAEEYVGKKYRKVITCQLGNGVSLCAIRDGKSIDTTMGFTPLEGLPMGTRSGNIDPVIVAFICEREKKTPEQTVQLLQRESGLKALSGFSDIRDILANEKKGDKRAKFALDFLVYQIRKQIGAYAVALNGIDGLFLGGGIARSPEMRRRICSRLDICGIVIDAQAVQKKAPIKISKGAVDVFVFETDEQQWMHELTREIV